MKIRIAGFEEESIVDGEGVRFVIFTQGCPHHCPGCHNPETHDFDGGKEYDTSEIVEMFKKNPLISGITISGGEPFAQWEACLELATEAHKLGLNVWCYTGYTFEELLVSCNISRGLLREVDFLVDGKFVLSRKSLELKFRGSSNQRIIDVQRSFHTHKTTIYNP